MCSTQGTYFKYTHTSIRTYCTSSSMSVGNTLIVCLNKTRINTPKIYLNTPKEHTSSVHHSRSSLHQSPSRVLHQTTSQVVLLPWQQQTTLDCLEVTSRQTLNSQGATKSLICVHHTPDYTDTSTISPGSNIQYQ